MKRFASIVILAATAALSSGQPSASSQNPDTEQIKKMITQMEDDWAAAIVRADLVTIDRIVAPDWTLVDETGKLFQKSQTDADLKSGNYKAASFKNNEVKVRVFGDAAVVSGVETQTSTYKGKDTSGQYRFTDVVIRRNGVWQVVATHASTITKD